MWRLCDLKFSEYIDVVCLENQSSENRNFVDSKNESFCVEDDESLQEEYSCSSDKIQFNRAQKNLLDIASLDKENIAESDVGILVHCWELLVNAVHLKKCEEQENMKQIVHVCMQQTYIGGKYEEQWDRIQQRVLHTNIKKNHEKKKQSVELSMF